MRRPDENGERAVGSDAVRAWLARAGAPLNVNADAADVGDHLPSLEDLIVAGGLLAREDAAVARVLSILIWRQRDHLSFPVLMDAARTRRAERVIGFFLELTAALSGDQRLLAVAADLVPPSSSVEPFFTAATGPLARKAAERRTPALARRWGFSMNMGLDSFESAFRKHVTDR